MIMGRIFDRERIAQEPIRDTPPTPPVPDSGEFKVEPLTSLVVPFMSDVEFIDGAKILEVENLTTVV